MSCRSIHRLSQLERLDLGSNEFTELVRKKKKGLTVKTDITWSAVISTSSLWPRKAWLGLKRSHPPLQPELLINSSVLCCIGCIMHWCIIYESVQTCSTWYDRELNAEWLSIWLAQLGVNKSNKSVQCFFQVTLQLINSIVHLTLC